jgi:signal transduction histidine kinase
MNRLPVRIVLSHLLIVLVGVTVAYFVARQLAPMLFVEDYYMTCGGGSGANDLQISADGQLNTGPGSGTGVRSLLDTASAAAYTAMAVAGGVAVVVAGLAGVFMAGLMLRPVESLREGTRQIAAGDYSVRIKRPRIVELAGLVDGVNSLAEELAETEQRRLRLLGEVAHEMRTPLTVLDGYVEGMLDNVIPTGPEELNELSAELRRLRRLADDLSALSRAEENRLNLELAYADLSDVVRAAARRLEPQIVDAGLTLVMTADEEFVTRLDADRVGQVVTNLIGNAIRATPPGGRIEVSTGRTGQRVWLRVTDTGEGLAADDLEQVFERFYRVPGRRQTKGESGSGIGLTMSRQFMRAQGGDLTATSDGLGLGATFEAWLPGLLGRSGNFVRKIGQLRPEDWTS